MLYSPFATAAATSLLTAVALLLLSDVKVDRHEPDGYASTGRAQQHQISMAHGFVGNGLKRDYFVQISVKNCSGILPLGTWKLVWTVPQSLIVDVFRLNRLALGGPGDERYLVDRIVDIESGMWMGPTPYTLTAEFDPLRKMTSSDGIIKLVVPEVMARYHLPDANCFSLAPPRLEISGVRHDGSTGGGMAVDYPPVLQQCVPTSTPSLLVPVLTILAPIVSSLYLIGLIKAV